MPKLTKEEIASLNFVLAQAQTKIANKGNLWDGITNELREEWQKELDKAKTVVAKLRTQK